MGNSGSANGGILNASKIPGTISTLLLVELSFHEFLLDICHFTL